MIRALEHCFLRSGHWPANSQSTKSPTFAPRKHSRASRRCARRPPPRFRFRTDWSSEQHLILVTRLASTFVSRERQNADVVAGTHYLSQAFGMRFDAAYWHVCKHRLALTGQGGPLDLRAQQCRPLLACYLSMENTSAGPPSVNAGTSEMSLLAQKPLSACQRCLNNQVGMPGPKV